MTQSNGMCYIGQFRNGVTNGKGKLISKDGSYFDGYWLNGEKSGVGVRYYSRNDRRRRETWYKGKFVKVLKDSRFK